MPDNFIKIYLTLIPDVPDNLSGRWLDIIYMEE